jgi:antitoxin (DNA-binding transcriptional repressor) of toxin-antitoxin stability system
MRSIEISEAQARLLELIDELERGEQKFLLLRNGQPIAMLMSIKAEMGKRIGVANGQFELPDDIDTSNDDVRNLFFR